MKTIIITGGTSGIGLDIANYFYKKNFNIAIAGIGNIKTIKNLKKRFKVNIDEIEAIKENVVFKIPKKLN